MKLPRPPSTLGAKRSAEGDLKAAELLVCVGDEEPRVVSDVSQQCDRAAAPVMGGVCFDPDGLGGLAQLTDEPIHPGQRSAIARRVEVDLTGHLAGTQIHGNA
jgi:hypothetical protein